MWPIDHPNYNKRQKPECNFLCRIRMVFVQSLLPLFRQVFEGQLLDTTLTAHNTLYFFTLHKQLHSGTCHSNKMTRCIYLIFTCKMWNGISIVVKFQMTARALNLPQFLFICTVKMWCRLLCLHNTVHETFATV